MSSIRALTLALILTSPLAAQNAARNTFAEQMAAENARRQAQQAALDAQHAQLLRQAQEMGETLRRGVREATTNVGRAPASATPAGPNTYLCHLCGQIAIVDHHQCSLMAPSGDESGGINLSAGTRNTSPGTTGASVNTTPKVNSAQRKIEQKASPQAPASPPPIPSTYASLLADLLKSSGDAKPTRIEAGSMSAGGKWTDLLDSNGIGSARAQTNAEQPAYANANVIDLSRNPTLEQLFAAPLSAYDPPLGDPPPPDYASPPTDERDYVMDQERQLYDRAVGEWAKSWREGKATYKDHPDRLWAGAFEAGKKSQSNWGGLTREGDAAFAYWDKIRAADERTARSIQPESDLAAGKMRSNMTSEQERYVRVFALSRGIQRSEATGLGLMTAMEIDPDFKQKVEGLRLTTGELARKYGAAGTKEDNAFDAAMEGTRKVWWEKNAHKFAEPVPAHASAYDPVTQPKGHGAPAGDGAAAARQSLEATKQYVETVRAKPPGR